VSAPLIEARALSKRFTRRGIAIWALQEITLQVAPGEFVALVGPSGCGKSTLLNLVAGLIEPTTGTLLYRGAPVHGPNTRVGYLTQTDSLLPWRTVADNVGLALEIRGVQARERHAAVQRQLALVGLAGFERAYPAELSGGMRKRASLAQTLIYDPETLLMDEPFGALDAQLKLLLQQQLLDVFDRSRKTILFVTHDLAEAVALADRVIVFTSRPGRIKLDAPIPLPRPRDVFQIRFTPEFGRLYETLWTALEGEITKGEAV
jgi:NitT/TauT family transport system ATP-binding protein